MKIIGAIFLLIVFVSPIYAQGLFDQAEIEFDVDYIDIGNVQILGNENKGRVMAVWLKNGNVLTKTLSNSKIKYLEIITDNPVIYSDSNRLPMSELENMSNEELISRIYDLLNEEWVNETTYLLFDTVLVLKFKNAKGTEYVQLTIDIINYNLEHGLSPNKLRAEETALKSFAEGDDELEKIVNDFLTEKGFNKGN